MRKNLLPWNTFDEKAADAQNTTQSFFPVVCWLIVLIAGWLEARFMCSVLHRPTDCHETNRWQVYDDLTRLAEKGIVIAWMCNFRDIRLSRRFRVLWCLLFLSVGPAFIGFGEIPALKSSLSGYPSGFNVPTITYTVIFVILFGVFAYQNYAICNRHGRVAFAIFLWSRMLVIGYYVGFGIFLSREYVIHVHHLCIGFLIACLAYDDSVTSQGFLCIGAGVMVQGIGSYNYATLISG